MSIQAQPLVPRTDERIDEWFAFLADEELEAEQGTAEAAADPPSPSTFLENPIHDGDCHGTEREWRLPCGFIDVTLRRPSPASPLGLDLWCGEANIVVVRRVATWQERSPGEGVAPCLAPGDRLVQLGDCIVVAASVAELQSAVRSTAGLLTVPAVACRWRDPLRPLRRAMERSGQPPYEVSEAVSRQGRGRRRPSLYDWLLWLVAKYLRQDLLGG